MFLQGSKCASELQLIENLFALTAAEMLEVIMKWHHLSAAHMVSV